MRPDTFEIRPFEGALPIRFGMPRDEVHEILGSPETLGTLRSIKATSDDWTRYGLNVRYHLEGGVAHIGFRPGHCVLRLADRVIWTPDEIVDPNWTLLSLDPAPKELLGFLIFMKLGVTTSGYHNGDASQHALGVFSQGEWDLYLECATEPDLMRYTTKPGS
jgi:hypothetical protein